MNAEQCRMARAALDWSTRQLCQAAGISARELQLLLVGGKASDLAAKRIQNAFEEHGLVFVGAEQNGQGAGVRFGKAPPNADQPKPAGPASAAVERMEADIAADRRKSKGQP